MNFLVLGNGFDIEHNLPTTYADFLNFLNNGEEYFKELTSARSKVYVESLKNKLPKKYDDIDCVENMDWMGLDAEFSFVEKQCKRMFLELNKNYDGGISRIEKIFQDKRVSNYNKYLIWFLVNGNSWYNHFKSQKDSLKPGRWLDIESEIKNVVIDWENAFYKHELISQDYFDDFQMLGIKKSDGEYNLELIMKKLSESLIELKEHLVNYLHIFEIVRDTVIEETRKTFISPDIRAIVSPIVINFNYTDTYSKVYGSVESMDFVHGKIGSQIVFGAGDSEVDKSMAAPLKKSKQINDCEIQPNYIEKLRNSRDLENNVYIFGHSVGESDASIFRSLINDEKISHVIVYYHDDDMKKNIKENLSKILGTTKLTKYMKDNKLEFIQQQNREEIDIKR